MVPRSHYSPLAAAIAWTALASSLPDKAIADIFLLEQGGQVEGEWLNRNEQPLTNYFIKTTTGLTLKLAIKDVREAVRQSPAEAEYARRSPVAANTAIDQWALAEWCRQNSLSRERQVHLQRVIEIDPNHQAARYALGYQFLRGEWVTREDSYRREGYEYYRGKWRTPQEIEILETRGRTDIAEKDWLVKLRRWRKDLDTDKAPTAHSAILAIKDPIAVRPIAEMFTRERVRTVKRLYADVLANIKTRDAVGVLADRALGDPDDEIFYDCLQRLVELRHPGITEMFVAALKDASNIRVNRAAGALASLEDKSAISPLIDALITTHQQVLPGAGPNATTSTFSDDGAFSKSADGPKVFIAHIQNQSVLSALSKLTGVDFAYDQRAWRYWHAQDKIAQETKQTIPSARRNE